MNRAAVVLGVDRCGPLPALRGAVSGAKRFAEWAGRNGFMVESLLDSVEVPVKAANIFNCVDALVRRHNISILFVYFAGHGVLLAPDCEYWLLANAYLNPNEAINLPGSIEAARNSGIEHVVFISDACRSRATFDWQTSVKGTVVFPSQRPRLPRPAIDRLFAALPGNPAWELDVITATQRYDGVFTDSLLKVLDGQIEDTIDQFDDPPPPIRVIQSFRTGEYLQREVPRRLASLDPRLNQTPDFIAESHRPKYLAFVGPGHNLEALTDPRSDLFPTRMARMAQSYNLGHYFGNSVPSSNTQDGILVRSFDEEVDRVHRSYERDNLETNKGFTVRGISVQRAAMFGQSDIFVEGSVTHIRVYDEDARTGLIQFANGSGVALPILPGFVGTVLVQNGGIESLAYAPANGTQRFFQYDKHEVDKRRAFASVAMSHGFFRVDVSNAKQFAGYIRQLKGFDPILGLFAAYAYSLAGLQEHVDDVYDFMAKEDVPLIFDVAMLANRWEKPVAPLCPLLRQSWAANVGRRGQLSPLLESAAAHLKPGLWTSFNSEGMEILFGELERGALV